MPVFNTTIWKDREMNATGIQVPDEIIAVLEAGRRPKVKVSLNGYTYRTTVAVMGGIFMLPLSAENREAARVSAGDRLDISIELDTEPRTVTVPEDLSAALMQKPGAASTFEGLSYSARKEFVRQVESAKTRETRERRIAGILAKLGDST
jgi:hypothetical protein